MPTVETAEEPSLHLSEALLIYTEAYSRSTSRVVVTRHPVTKGQIMPGEPLDLPSFRKLLDHGLESDAPATTNGWTWHFPRTLAESRDRIAWWSPPRIHDVYIGQDGKRTRTVKAWSPALLWVASRTAPSCRLYAYDGDREPSPGTDVHRPRFGPEDGTNHIHDDCSICVGSMTLPDYSPASWERGFWSSRFKTTGNYLRNTQPYVPSKVFKKIGTAESVLARS